MGRLTIAYLLIGFLVFGLGATVAWRVYHSRNRSIRRERAAEGARRRRTPHHDNP
jgi:hypothetical protein